MPHTKTVAVVEDDASMLKGIERLLSVHGFAAESYSSAEAFLNRAATSQASCLIVDIHLGGMSGIELKRQLNASGSTRPVIFMTAVDSDEIQKEARGAGCFAYLHKPFAANLLIDAINRTPA